MTIKNIFSKSTISLALLFALVLPAALLIFSSCTDTLDGEVTANAKPVVYFVNIPPAGQEFSRNPVIYWYGSDEDGQIDYFRYHVATAGEISAVLGVAPGYDGWVDDYTALLISDDWIYLDVDPTAADPQTSSIVQMSADLTDPVNTSVLQYVFIQAFDTEGTASDVASRLFSRIDNPPQTAIYGIALDSPFVNAETAGGVITGVKMRWFGTDPIDYPSDPPPFEYEWKLFGPYLEEEFFGNDTLAGLDTSYISLVYVTSDARVFDLGDSVFRCDTFFVGETQTIDCDTLIVTDSTETTAFGGLEPFFRTEDLPDDLYRVADSSGDGINPWISATADTIFDVFSQFYASDAGANTDTTIEMYYLFQVRSRDDAGVADLAPAFRTFTVIDPAHEREICVVDFTFPYRNYTVVYSFDTAKAYWYNQIQEWAQSRPDLNLPTGLALFDTTRINDDRDSPFRRQGKDYLRPTYVTPRLVELLKHKVVIIYADDIRQQDFHARAGAIYTAIDAGVNVWVTARCLLTGGTNSCSAFNLPVPADYTRYFGVVGQAYSGWYGNLRNANCAYFPNNPADFVGGYSMDLQKWPDVSVDSARLHRLYRWSSSLTSQYRWHPDIPALPEVNWSSRAFGTEVMYLYASLHGGSHPMGFLFNFDGSPVAHRFVTTQFKTVHFNFTTPSLATDSATVLINGILDWLYPDDVMGSASVVDRYKDASVKISLEEAQANFVRRRTEQVDLMRLMEGQEQLR